MQKLLYAMLFLAGVIHLLPLPGVLGADTLVTLYGIAVDGKNLEILLRHRAILFGILGSLLLAAIFRPALRPAAILAGLASTASFLVIAWQAGDYNAQLARVLGADVLALLCLLVAGGVQLRSGSPSTRPLTARR